MIQQLPIWQMAVDLGLIAAVMTMAIRWMKGSRAQALLPQTIELEAALRNLIAEAEVAGRQLNDQLLRRENNIQRYLTELEDSERRIARSVVEGEEVAKRIEGISSTAQSRLQEVISARAPGAPLSQAAPSSGMSASAQQSVAPQASAAQPQASQQAAKAQASAPQRRAPQGASQSAPAPSGSTAPASKTPSQAYSSAAKQAGGEIHRVYAAAEKMIREGHDAESVAARTKLPLEGVKLLSQMIEVERTDEAAVEAKGTKIVSGDPRLGALGATRRQLNA